MSMISLQLCQALQLGFLLSPVLLCSTELGPEGQGRLSNSQEQEDRVGSWPAQRAGKRSDARPAPP